MTKYEMYASWAIDSLKWIVIFVAVVLVFSYNFSGTLLEPLHGRYGVWLNFSILMITVGIFVIVAEFYGYIKSYREYSKDPEASYLIGRMTCGIDHRGRPTRRVKIKFFPRKPKNKKL